MKILHIISLVLCLSSIQGYPTRPLDDVDRNLTWVEAWDGDEMTRKKVVPKSVFIAPDFGSTPKCPAGHERDSRGNCVKLHTLDSDSQLNFLFEKILAGLPSSDVDTPDPVRLNVPIDHTEPVDDKVNLALVFSKDQNEDDIAVVVSPTNGSFSPDKLSLHKDEDQPDPGEVTTITELDTTTTTITTTTTTIQEEEDNQPTIQPTTMLYTTDPTTTTMDTTTITDTTTMYPTTITDISTTETTSQRVTDTTFTTTSNSGDEAAATTEVFDETNGEAEEIFFKMSDMSQDFLETTTMSMPDYSTNYVSSNVVFPDAEHVRQSTNFVSFPDDEEANKKRPQRHDNPAELFYFSHRNRDKNLWRFSNFERKLPSAASVEEKSSQLFKQLEQLSSILNKRKSR